MPTEIPGREVPPRALTLSLAALAVPVVAALQLPEQLGEYAALLWLLALVPAFLLAYHRGWRGVATSLAVGMATLSLTQVAANVMGRDVPQLLLGIVVAYVAITLGIGWMADALHRDRAEVEDMAFTDLLTRLPNRRHARLFLENEFAAAERGRPLSVVLFDLDHFKRFNDRLGHAAGDEALRAFGDILRRTTRRMDLSARFGGEEFVTFLTSTDTEGAVIFADRIREALSGTPLSKGDPLTVSAGVASYHPNMRSPDELLAAADHALYEAKHGGRNTVRLYGAAIMEQAMPSADAAEGLLERLEDEPPDYPRPSEALGRSKPPLTLLPHQITEFGLGSSALVVEDDPQVRSLVVNYLAREGFDTAEAGDVPGGVAQLGREFDVVVVDLRLPGAPGTELISAVKSRWPTTQVLVITGLHDAQVAAEALSAGADRYLFKPFGMPDLRKHLTEALRRREHLLSERAKGRSASSEARERRERALSAVLEGTQQLVRATELHEPMKRGHGRRVAAYARLLAEALNASAAGLDHWSLELGCRLHDVGKLGVNDELLNRAAVLSPEEMRDVRGHAGLGRSILAPLLDDEDALAVVAWHHERWDGRGYPDGLAADSIPLAARIAAVCDALDAMTTPRPHREPRAWDEALEEIRRCAGTQFDPTVVEALTSQAGALRSVFEAQGPSAT